MDLELRIRCNCVRLQEHHVFKLGKRLPHRRQNAYSITISVDFKFTFWRCSTIRASEEVHVTLHKGKHCPSYCKVFCTTSHKVEAVPTYICQILNCTCNCQTRGNTFAPLLYVCHDVILSCTNLRVGSISLRKCQRKCTGCTCPTPAAVLSAI